MTLAVNLVSRLFGPGFRVNVGEIRENLVKFDTR